LRVWPIRDGLAIGKLPIATMKKQAIAPPNLLNNLMLYRF
jgi:hypothetical protein